MGLPRLNLIFNQYKCQPSALFYGTKASSVDPDQVPHYVASDQGLHFWPTEFPLEIE